MLIGETGALEVDQCDRIGYHNEIWSSAFMGGISTGLHWNWRTHWVNNDYENFLPLSNFLAGVDYEENNWEPYLNNDELSIIIDDNLEAFIMRNHVNDEIMGWVHNRSAYWANVIPNCHYEARDDQGQPLGYFHEYPDDDDPNLNNNNYPNQIVPQVSSVLIISGLQTHRDYNVIWYNTYTGTQNTSAQQNGHVYDDTNLFLSVPPTDASNPDWAVKVYPVGEEFRSLIPRLQDTVICINQDFKVAHLLKNIDLSSINFRWELSNGQSSENLLASFLVSQKGVYYLKCYKYDGHYTDTLNCRVFAIDCNKPSKQNALPRDENKDKYNNITFINKHPTPDFLTDDIINQSNNDISNPIITVFPVPSSGIVTLQISNGVFDGCEMKIFNSYGSLIIEQKKLSGKIHKTDLSSFSPGIYHINLINENYIISKKIVIQKP